MENIAPITFHGGNQKRLQDSKSSAFHIEQAFVGDDDQEKKKRYELYKKYSDGIVNDYKELRDEVLKESAEKILEHLTLQASIQKSKDIVPMVTVLFKDTAIPAINDAFDTLQEDDKMEQFRVARLETGGGYTNVEEVVDAVTEQLIKSPDSLDQRNGFQRLLQEWKIDSKSAKEIKSALIILDDILSFDGQVLEDFLLLVAQFKSFGFPIFVTAGFPHSNSITSVLSARVVRKYVFESVTVSMDGLVKTMLDKIGVSAPSAMPFRLSPRAFKLLALTANRNGATCQQLINVYKLILLEHFRSKVGSVQCLTSDELNKTAVEIKESTATPKSTRKTRLLAKRQETVELHAKSLLKIDEYRACYLIATRILHNLASMNEWSAKPIPDEISVICASADEDFFGSDLFADVLSNMSGSEVEKIEKVVTDSIAIVEEYRGVETSSILTDFNCALRQFKSDLSRLDDLQAEANRRAAEAGQNDAATKPKVHPNRSSKLNAAQQNIEKKKAVQPINVLEKMTTDFRKALKTFLVQALVPPSKEAISTVYFDDIDFLRLVLSPSTRRILSIACSNHKYGSRFDIFEEFGPNISLAKWFEAFMDDQKENNVSDDMAAANFYKMLSAMEFVGLISKGQKKGFVTKLCWTTGFIE